MMQQIHGTQSTPQCNEESRGFREFYGMNYPKLHGDLGLLKAQDHLTSIEVMFELTPCSKEDMVICATHMLIGHAARW